VRENTERPITITEGTNTLVPDPGELVSRVRALKESRPAGRVPEGWDGHAAERIVDALARHRLR
jgi:UDP-N-acetylglucosamine 2-epimerase (non-hydrolysing)